MRITCPNCGAQYEVDARVIPDLGRDVQCSNCGHTWFQRPQSVVAASVRRVVEDPPVSPGPDADAAAAGETDVAPGPVTRPADAFPPIAVEPAATEVAPADAAPPPAAWDATQDRTDSDAAPMADAPGAPGAPDTPEIGGSDRPTIDDATRALLREEAEREAQARAAERRPAIETQGDFDLAETPPAPRPAQRSADLSGPADAPAAGASVAAAVAAAATRRDSLPEVDTITSGLRADPADTGSDAPADDLVQDRPRRGFRAGFVLPVLFVTAAAAVYLLAPALAEAVPALRAPLSGYVDSVNALRGWIAATVSG